MKTEYLVTMNDMLFTLILAKELYEKEKPHLAGESLLTCVALEGLGVLPPCS
jgi:hypothetical protein